MAIRLFGARNSRILLTAEHASCLLPHGYSWSEKDKRLVGMHWAADHGTTGSILSIFSPFNYLILLISFMF